MKCTYVKIANEGGKLPTSETVKDFVNICSNFIENNPLKKIGKTICLAKVSNMKLLDLFINISILFLTRCSLHSWF